MCHEEVEQMDITPDTGMELRGLLGFTKVSTGE